MVNVINRQANLANCSARYGWKRRKLHWPWSTEMLQLSQTGGCG